MTAPNRATSPAAAPGPAAAETNFLHELCPGCGPPALALLPLVDDQLLPALKSGEAVSTMCRIGRLGVLGAATIWVISPALLAA